MLFTNPFSSEIGSSWKYNEYALLVENRKLNCLKKAFLQENKEKEKNFAISLQ